MELQGRLGELRKAGLGVAAISYDKTEILSAFAGKHGITFPLLSDAGSATIKAYGILNTVAAEALATPTDAPAAVEADVRKYIAVTGSRRVAAMADGTPFPGTFTVDAEGRVTSRHFEDFYRERRSVANVLLQLGNRPAAVRATQVSTDHLELVTYPADDTVVPGQRTALALEIAPKPRMHVYAPGATGYRMVQLTLTPDPLVRALPIAFPASEIYYFAPLDERVPVYQKPFRLLQEVVLEVRPEAERAFRERQSITISGALEYQACDDKICFNPVVVPLSWTLAVARH